MFTKKTGKKNAIIITGSEGLIPVIKGALLKKDVVVDSTYSSLSSLHVIKKAIMETGNTVFIRKAFLRFIRESGMPDLIVIDYRIDLGLKKGMDPDNRKLLRTFLISYILLYKKNSLHNIKGNFILIGDNNFSQEIEMIKKNPVVLLDMIKTTNDSVNSVIDNLISHPDMFNEMFNIEYIDRSASSEEITSRIVDFLSARVYMDKDNEEARKENEAVQEKLKESNIEKIKKRIIPEKGEVIYRLNVNTVFHDNRQVDYNTDPIHRYLTIGQFYVRGGWSFKNQHEIAGNIRDAVLNGIGGKQFRMDEDIIVNLCLKCEIDKTVVASLMQLFMKDLSGFKNKKAIVNFKNASVLERSTGYNIIKDFIFHTY